MERNVLLRARFSVAMLKSNLTLRTALHEHWVYPWKLRTWGASPFFFNFKTLSGHFLILGAVVSSPWQTGDLKSQILQRTGSVQPFSLSYAYKIVVVTRLSAFINVFAAWTWTGAGTSSFAKEKTRNEALGYSELPWERFRVSVKYNIFALVSPSWVSLF